MKRNATVCIGVLLFALAGPLGGQDQAERRAQYKKWMKEVGAATERIKKNLDGKLEAIAADAERLADLFDEVESYWILADVEDAQEWALQTAEAAEELAEESATGDAEAARAAFQTMSSNCAACHKAHREKLPGGGYRLKK